MRILFRATFALVPVLCLSASACSSTTTQGDAGPVAQVCPTTINEATTPGDTEGTSSKCHVENFACVVGFSCNNFVQQATCVCQGGTFACSLNADGTALDTPETDPQCQTSAGSAAVCELCKTPGTIPSDTCPTDKTQAQDTPCKAAGQICDYLTTCSGSPPPTDVCQCDPNAKGDAGLSWVCDLNSCP